MAAAGGSGGGVKASANMRALLADNDPGDSEAAKTRARETEAAEAYNPPAQGGGGAAMDGGNEKKKKRKKARGKKQKPVAVNGGEDHQMQQKGPATAMSSAQAEAAADESDGEEAESSGGGGRCLAVLRGLLRAVVVMALLAFWAHVAATRADNAGPAA